MATLQQIANVFDDNFKHLSGGQGARYYRREDGLYAAVFGGVEEVFSVPDEASRG